MLSVIRLSADASAMQMRCCSPVVSAVLTQNIKNPVFLQIITYSIKNPVSLTGLCTCLGTEIRFKGQSKGKEFPTLKTEASYGTKMF